MQPALAGAAFYAATMTARSSAPFNELTITIIIAGRACELNQLSVPAATFRTPVGFYCKEKLTEPYRKSWRVHSTR